MATNGAGDTNGRPLQRTSSISQGSEASQTAQEYISSQLQLEADAREALPYQFDTCTKPLGPLRQSLYSCLTCNPPPADPSKPYDAAGVCYSCSISCHGEHELVELFSRRNFVCDCGTTRMPDSSPCLLRINTETGMKGDVRSEEAAATNTYNHNFRNRFCGCGELYDAHSEKGTMFQCLGIGTVVDGGCGEDWWHPECLLGLGRDWQSKLPPRNPPESFVPAQQNGTQLQTILEDGEENQTATDTVRQAQQLSIDQNDVQPEPEDPPLPPGFPNEDDFEHLLCYKCTNAYPWIKRYAGAPKFHSALFCETSEPQGESSEIKSEGNHDESNAVSVNGSSNEASRETGSSKKRKADDEVVNEAAEKDSKRAKSEDVTSGETIVENSCKYSTLPPLSSDANLSLFLPEDFRDHLCRCTDHFSLLASHAQLLEEEEPYEPPISDSGEGGNETGSLGSRSLLDRGEAALSNMDRVRAIEGVMAYNHVRDKVKDFLKPFAESGTPVSAEDIKTYFARLRGDADAQNANSTDDGGPGEGDDNRREQSGY